MGKETSGGCISTTVHIRIRARNPHDTHGKIERGKGGEEKRCRGGEENQRGHGRQGRKKATGPSHFAGEGHTGSARWLEAPRPLVICVCHSDSRRMGAPALAYISEGDRMLLCPALADVWKGKERIRLGERGHLGCGGRGGGGG